jgi:hypothetical protein
MCARQIWNPNHVLVFWLFRGSFSSYSVFAWIDDNPLLDKSQHPSADLILSLLNDSTNTQDGRQTGRLDCCVRVQTAQRLRGTVGCHQLRVHDRERYRRTKGPLRVLSLVETRVRTLYQTATIKQ